jgi:hypothetical protein
VVTTSWGTCEPISSSLTNQENVLFEAAAAQGQTILAASGDNGSACNAKTLAVQDPASQPYVTGVGGTTINALGPPPSETAWSGSGGGISGSWAMPSYQSNAAKSLNVIGPDASGSPCGAVAGEYCREVPDVSADADVNSGYEVYLNGNWSSSGGTSLAAPLWAAFIALTNASSTCKGTDVGFANPALYLAAVNFPTAFNDVTQGNTDVSGTNGGLYPAGTGYDMATGLGTPNGGVLSSALCQGGVSAPDVITVTRPGNQTGTVGTPVDLPITAADSASGQPLSYSANGLPPGLSIQPSSGLISGAPTSSGNNAVTVTVEDPSGASDSVTFTWTINPSTSTSVPAGSPIVGVASGRCLGVVGASTVPGAALEIRDCSGVSAQAWTLISSTGTLTVYGAPGSSSSLCLGVPVSQVGTTSTPAVKTQSCVTGATTQSWTFQSNGNLVNVAAQQCLTVVNAATANGSGIFLYNCNTGGNEEWSGLVG